MPASWTLHGAIGGRPVRLAALAWLACLVGVTSISGAASAQARSARPAVETAVLDAQAFGVEAHLEIEQLADRALTRDALAEALDAIRRAEGLLSLDPSALPTVTDGVGGGVAELNRGAGAPVTVDAELFALLERALAFCRFSEGAFGPLGGQLIELWGLRRPVTGRPTLAALSQASASASCDRLRLERAGHQATLAAGSVVDLLSYEHGFAVDRAVSELRERGAENGWVQIGHVARAFGPGPDGKGWPIAVDTTNPVITPTERLLLRDRSLALAASWIDPIEIAGDVEAPHVDHRTGRSVSGTIAVLAVTETATDAAGLAASLFVVPQRVGLFRLGSLQPAPAVKWFLGTGDGPPLIAERGWAELPKWRAPRSPLEGR